MEGTHDENLAAAEQIEQRLVSMVAEEHSGQPVLVVVVEHNYACCVIVLRWSLPDLVHVPQSTVLTKRAVNRLQSSGVATYRLEPHEGSRRLVRL